MKGKKKNMNSLIVYDTEELKCKFIAEKLSFMLDIPCVNINDNPDIKNIDILVLIFRRFYGGDSSREMCQFAKNLSEKPRVILISSLLYYGGPKKVGISVGRGDSGMYYGDKSQLHALLIEKNIEIFEEIYCYRSFLFLGRVTKSEIERVGELLQNAIMCLERVNSENTEKF